MKFKQKRARLRTPFNLTSSCRLLEEVLRKRKSLSGMILSPRETRDGETSAQPSKWIRAQLANTPIFDYLIFALLFADLAYKARIGGRCWTRTWFKRKTLRINVDHCWLQLGSSDSAMQNGLIKGRRDFRSGLFFKFESRSLYN